MDISFIIPIYNKEQYIEQCINSITQISSNNIEILLIDDGSTDKSYEKCCEFAQNDIRIKVFHQENMGVSAARNKGLTEAIGKYVFFVDSDDIIIPKTVEKFLLNKIKSDMICFDYYIELDGKSQLTQRQFGENGNVAKKEWEEHLFSNKNNMIWNNLYRLDIIKDNNLYFPVEVKMGEDFIFNINYLKVISDIYYINAPLYIYRSNVDNSAMKQIKLNYILDYIAMDKELSLYYRRMDRHSYAIWMEYFLNMVCKILILSNYNRKDYIIREFEESRLYNEMISFVYSSNKLVIKQIIIKMKLYHNIYIKKLIKFIVY